MTPKVASPLLPVHHAEADYDVKDNKCYCSDKIMATVSILGSLIALVLFATSWSTIHSQDPSQFYITSAEVIRFPDSTDTTLAFDLSIYNPNPADYYNNVRAYVLNDDDSLSIPRKDLLFFETEAPPVRLHGSNTTMASALLETDDLEVAARITGRVDIILLVDKTKPRSWMQYYWKSNDVDQVMALCPNVLFTDYDFNSRTSDHPYKCRVV